MNSLSRERGGETTLVFGGGLAGLSAGYVLTRAGRRAVVFEADSAVGGLSKTLRAGEFRFDIGGHRFFTREKAIEDFVRDLMGDELIEVCRTSKIYLRNRYFDYPLRPANAISGLGLAAIMRIVLDYSVQRLRRVLRPEEEMVSLEDWVVRNFGRTLFNIYFKEYSEKVWGLDCSRISQQWVARRIHGLSLATAIKGAFFKISGREVPTLADCFLYPELGIGRISERLKEGILAFNRVFTSTGVAALNCEGCRIESAVVENGGRSYAVRGRDYVSTIPLTSLVAMMRPEAPAEVLEAASSLGYRDMVLAAVVVNRRQVTDQTWIYIPERKIPFGRLHEPKNWSPRMAPEDRSLLVVEYFCFRGDGTWQSTDEELSRTTVQGLRDLGFIKGEEVMETFITRVPGAYPLFEVGYEKPLERIYDYLGRFENLSLAGRAGMFKYQNMDHAMEAGMKVAEEILRRRNADEVRPGGACVGS